MEQHEERKECQLSSVYLSRIVENEQRNQFICSFVSELLQEQIAAGIVYVKYIKHAKMLADLLSEELNVVVPCITGRTNQAKKTEVINKLKDGTLHVAVATLTWATGIDIPILQWILWAGAGRAPIALLESAGRVTRKHDEKIGFTVYDLQDHDGGNYEDQAATRLQHFTDAGFNIDAPSEDAQLLQQIFEMSERKKDVLDSSPYSSIIKPTAQSDHAPTAETLPDPSLTNVVYATFDVLTWAVLAIILVGIVVGIFAPIK